MKKRLCALLLIALAWTADARDLTWQRLDTLPDGDRARAEQTLTDMWGTDPDQWPDWIDPAALYVPTAQDWLLIVRRPLHAACGQYGFALFSVLSQDGQRQKTGDFCAGTLSVVAVSGRDWPDLLIAEGNFPNKDGEWHRLDLRLRWQNGQWLQVL